MADFSAGYIVGIILSGIIMIGVFVFLLSHDGRIIIQQNYSKELNACQKDLADNQATIGRACPAVKCSFPSYMYVMSIIMILFSGGIYVWTLIHSSKKNNELLAREMKLKEKERLAVPIPPKIKKR